MKLSLEQERYPWGTRRTVRLREIERAPSHQHDIFFDLVGEISLPAPSVLDGFVMAVIFYAMRLGEDIHVDGSLSQDALWNLGEFQEAWRAWRPEVYRRINISAKDILQKIESGAKSRALSAFSGGVDACFTLVRHRERLLDDYSYPLDSVMMVHGFDVPIDQHDTFDALVARVSPMLDEFGVRLRIVRTNLKALDLQDWEDSHMSQLAACLHNLSHEFSYGVVGSTKAYDDLLLPYGSNPVTDQMLSGAAMRLIHDGAGYTRTEKVSLLAEFPQVRSVLKVCWEGADGSRNCGVCEKCVRTHLNFLAAGCSQPECFEYPLDEKLIKTITCIGEPQARELVAINAFAEKQGLHGRWLTLLRRRLAAYHLGTPLSAFWYAEFKLRRGLAKLGRWL